MQFAPVFQDHAVLQRDQSIPVWGKGVVGEVVTVTLAESSAVGTADSDGNWLVRLPPQTAGGPLVLTAQSRSGCASVRDILVGEVWVCSGQSNMEWQLGQCGAYNHSEDLPQVRLLTVGTPARLGRQTALDRTWEVGTPAALAAFSAVGGWFGRRLHKELGVPVGLISNAWGGSRVQAWISREGLMRHAAGREEVRQYESCVFTPDYQGQIMPFALWEERVATKMDTGNAGLANGWEKADCNDAEWASMPIPSRWQEHGHAGSGVFWFRLTLTIPVDWIGRDLKLHLGAIDKHDDTYVNGERVGGLSWEAGPSTWNTPRVYRVPSQLVHGHRLTIAVRARSHIYHGGMIGPAEQMRLCPQGDESAAVSLAGTWRYAVEQDWGAPNTPADGWCEGNPNSPYTLFNSRLHPLIPYGIRGVIWYQGESNAEESGVYRRLLPIMIADWRRAWGEGDFPFIQVQLANFMNAKEAPAPSDWALLREAQLVTTRAVPNCGMAVAIDVGDATDIHPQNKQPVGERLASWALCETYGKHVVPSGPVFESLTVEVGGRCRCRFRHATGLQTLSGGAVCRVEIAGSNRAFRWAQAVIEGDTLLVWHPEIPHPFAVRYAWSDNPAGCNLVNGANLPATPFRTDVWE
jgi:sialate O-acetylesterase